MLLALTLLAPAACASTVSGTAVADPAATATTPPPTTTTTTEGTTTQRRPSGGSDTLDDPTIAVATTAPDDGQPFCDLVSPAELTTAFGLTEAGESVSVFCQIRFAEGGYVFQHRGRPVRGDLDGGRRQLGAHHRGR